MSSGPDLRPDYYLTFNGSTGGVPDTDRMFSGRLLARNTWKLTNNGCETVVHGTQLMTYILWGIIKRCFPVSLSPVQKRSSNIRSITGCQLLMRCTSFYPVLVRTCTVMSVNCPVHVRQLCGHCAFYALHTRIARASSNNGDDFLHQRGQHSSPDNFLSQFCYLCDVCLCYPARCDKCFSYIGLYLVFQEKFPFREIV